MQTTDISNNIHQEIVCTDAGITHVRSKDEVTIDTILINIGQFGKFQTIIFFLICFPMLFNAIFSITYVFTASTVVHRCFIEECDTAESQYQEKWTNFTIPSKGSTLDQCNRYGSALDENITTLAPPVWGSDNVQDDDILGTCQVDDFNRSQIQRCPTDNLVFRDKEVTISNEVI